MRQLEICDTKTFRRLASHGTNLGFLSVSTQGIVVEIGVAWAVVVVF